MIIYFANRNLDIIGQASTGLRKGLIAADDKKTDDIETGVSIFEFDILFDAKTRLKAEQIAAVGNYVLRSDDGEGNLYQIIESEVDTKKQRAYIYAEDDGMDLLNEIVGEYAADKAYPITHYINMYASSAGFLIGTNEAADLTRKLSWDGETTAAARIASIATQFNGCEVSYSFKVDGLNVVKKYINIYKQRGKDIAIPLRLNEDVDSIITTKSIANLATAFKCTGATPEDKEDPITLKGYKYDDGDFYVDTDGTLKSRKALEKWKRLLWKDGEKQQAGGHITKLYSYDTESQKELCAHAITELKKVCDIEINFDVDIKRLPDNVQVGDRVNIIDDAGELYLSTRILILETSICDQTNQAVLGEHLIKKSGISQKVMQLADQFAKTSVSVQRAKEIANTAKAAAEESKTQAQDAANQAEEAKQAAERAESTTGEATKAALSAEAAAQAAEAAATKAESSVTSMEQTVKNAQTAVENAEKAAQTAEQKAEEAETAASNAKTDAEDAKQAAEGAKSSAKLAIERAAGAVAKAENAKTTAQAAIDTAQAAKLDAAAAERDIATLGERIETVSSTMKADYARKTELTEATAHLESKIERNAAGVSSTVSLLQTIDETANDAREKADLAQAEAAEARAKADAASEAADAAQSEADIAKQAAIDAQAEADIARQAANTAQDVANQAQLDLMAAQEDLATIEARADATEEEIAAAQKLVDDAQAEADIAIGRADAAIIEAEEAQEVASAAVIAATLAQDAADKAKADAELAEKVAERAAGDSDNAVAEALAKETLAGQAIQTAQEAVAEAEAAQDIANTAASNAAVAQASANAAAANAAAALKTATAARLTADKSEQVLAEALVRLEQVQNDAQATEAELAKAQEDVEAAQAAADEADAAAQAAEAESATAQTAAQEAQSAANEALAAATEAQTAADEAQDRADEAQAVVDGLELRVTNAETKITQNAREFRVSVKEVEEATNAHGTKITEAASEIQLLKDAIAMLVTDNNGSSLMTQTANGWTFNIAQILDSIDKNASDTNTTKEDLEGLETALNGLKQSVNDLGVLADYVIITTYNGQPCIELGEGENQFKLRITNTEIHFADGSSIPAYITNQKLMIEKAEVKNELQFGGFVWKIRESGNMGLIWKGVDE